MTVREVEMRYGRPYEAAFLADYAPAEFDFLKGTMRDGRSQDVTVLVRRAGLVAMIRKPLYPPECFRAPGGCPRSGEDLAAAGDPIDGARDLLWVMLNTREFMVNH